MLNNKKTFSVVLAAVMATFMSSVPAAQARFDDIPVTLVPRLDRVTTASITPQVQRPSVRKAPDYNVFRSVVVPVGRMSAFAQWTQVRPGAGRADGCAKCGGQIGARLAELARRARGMDQVEALDLVNRTVNGTIAYRSDKGDHWQTLAESAKRGYGDCEDYAIAKMALLAGIGFAPEQLQFIVLKDTRRQLYHAVLAVHVEGKRYILDNLSNTLASDAVFRSYKPIVSFVGAKSYVHGFKSGETAVAMGKGGYSSIKLGN